MKLPIIAFVCVNYENSNFTLEFCRSLSLQSGVGRLFEIACVVVDNSFESVDSLDLRRSLKEFEWVSYVAEKKNLGYFGGLNFGIGGLSLGEIDFLVLCNNDLFIDSMFCASISSKKYAPHVYAICPDVFTVDGVHQNPHIKDRISWWRRFQFDCYFSHYFFAWILTAILKIVRSKKKGPGTKSLVEQEIHMGIGACYVLTREFLEKFEKLDYPNFLYGEEAYFSNQIHLAGGILWFDPSLVAHHAESASLSKIPKRVAYDFAREGYSDYRRML